MRQMLPAIGGRPGRSWVYLERLTDGFAPGLSDCTVTETFDLHQREQFVNPHCEDSLEFADAGYELFGKEEFESENRVEEAGQIAEIALSDSYSYFEAEFALETSMSAFVQSGLEHELLAGAKVAKYCAAIVTAKSVAW